MGKRIFLFVSNDLACDNRVNRVAVTLTNAGHEVTVVGRKLPQSLPLPNVPYQTKRMRFLFRKSFLFYAEMNLRYFLFLLFSRYDIATANDLDTLLGVYLAVKLRRKEIVYDSHEFFTEVPELIGKPVKKSIWISIERHILPKLHHCMTVCKSISEEYRNLYDINMQVVRNVPFRKTEEIVPATVRLPSQNVILYQGALNVGRGLELAIDSLEFLTDSCLLIVGDGDKFHELKEYAREKTWCDRIVFIGRVPFSDLAKYTALASVGISLEEDLGKNYRFALPNKLFDYIQAGKPVVVSNLPEMSEIVSSYKCGEILKERSPQVLAQLLEKIICDETMEYQKGCIRASEELCWERESTKVVGLYNELIAGVH